MRMTQNYQKSKICPRCGIKCLEGVEECPDCGLVFSRLELATNKDAKKKLLRGDRDFIIRTNKLPSDVKYIKLLLIALFAGFTGAHNFYTGRFLKGFILLFDFLVIVMCAIFNGPIGAVYDGNLLTSIMTISGFIMLMWPIDFFLIAFKRYKVPVAIDLEGKVVDKAEEK